MASEKGLGNNDKKFNNVTSFIYQFRSGAAGSFCPRHRRWLTTSLAAGSSRQSTIFSPAYQ